MGNLARLIIFMTAVIVLDQWSKAMIQGSFFYGEVYPVIDGFFNLTYVKNSGIAFGIGQGVNEILRILMFIVLPLFVTGWLAYLIFIFRNTKILLATSYSFIFAGAFGNLIDRIFLGHVVDFLQFYYNDHYFPSFNVADSAITIGACLLVIDHFLHLRSNASDPVQK